MTKKGQTRRLVAVIVALVMVLGYSAVAVSMAVEASNPVKRELSPFFSQKWNVFAPNIQKRDYYLEVRSRSYDDDGKITESEWIPVTEVERLLNKGSLAPSRIQKLSQNTTSVYLSRFNKLKTDQRETARKNFVSVDGKNRNVMSDSEVVKAIQGEEKNSSRVVNFVRMDYMLVRYATVYAEAYTGEKARDVQWRIIGDRNNDFNHRFMDDKQFETSVRTFGWRAADASPYELAVEHLENMIERQEGR
ncbi:DUF5819 family protein [Glutamicibacter sp. 2E12]|uniref:DUF5819 family protein n=1 Tax=Glutamicibacter sp. 2E12 TaxID=3416181 RepID=UPI003CEE5306